MNERVERLTDPRVLGAASLSRDVTFEMQIKEITPQCRRKRFVPGSQCMVVIYIITYVIIEAFKVNREY